MNNETMIEIVTRYKKTKNSTKPVYRVLYQT